MHATLRNAYLEALGIDRWVSRHAAPELPAAEPEVAGATAVPDPAPLARSAIVPAATGRPCASRFAGLHRLRSLQDAHPDRVWRRQHTRRMAGHRRGARCRRGPPGRAIRRARRSIAERHAAGHRPAARDRVHRQHPQVPAARQSRSEAGRGRALPCLPAGADQPAEIRRSSWRSGGSRHKTCSPPMRPLARLRGKLHHFGAARTRW